MANPPDTRKHNETREHAHPNHAPERAAHAAERAAGESTEQGIKAARSAAEAAGEGARRAAELGEQTARAGLRAAAEAQQPLVEASYEGGRRLIESTARVTDLYRAASEQSAEDVQALVAAASSLSRGLQEWQHTWLSQVGRSMERLRGRPQAMLRARNLTELAEVQRDLYAELVEEMVTNSATLLELAGRIAQDAARPLLDRARHARAA